MKPDELSKTITAYWDERAQSYSNGVNGELDDSRRDAWEATVSAAVRDVLDKARRESRTPRIADLGCGPGFFSVLFADAGCEVDAIDGSAGMLEQARANVNRQAPGSTVSFRECDLLSLPFADGTFDVCISRNVMWLMREPESAYAEWLRVLRPGGKLIAFDANWYRYLVDPALDALRREDQRENDLDDYAEDARATTCEEERCELIAAELPLTPVMRPAWDSDVLNRMGAGSVKVNEDAWRSLWTQSEQAYYRTSPLFMVEAVK